MKFNAIAATQVGNQADRHCGSLHLRADDKADAAVLAALVRAAAAGGAVTVEVPGEGAFSYTLDRGAPAHPNG